MPLLGHLALWLALLLGVWGAVTGFAAAHGHRPDLAESARRAVAASGVALGVALGALVVALLRGDYAVAYVAAHTDRALPTSFRWAALVAGSEGRGLLWGTAVAWCAAAAPARGRPAFSGLVSAVLAVTVAVLLWQGVLALSPYTPVDGRGLDPAFQNQAMPIATLLMLIGAATAVLPFGWEVSSWLSRRSDPERVFASRGWVSFAWLALTAAITIGMWSDYRTEGWSGAWAWAPLDRRWLPVWLALSALLHTVTVSRLEREFRTLHRGLCAAAGPLAAWAAFPAGSSTAGLLGATSAALAFALVIVLRVALRRRLQPRVPLRSERLGMHAAHVGMLLVLAPLAALGWRERAQAVLRSGQSATLPTRSGGEYRFTYLAVSHYPAANRIVTRAVLDVRRDGRRVGRLAPEQVQIIDVFGNASFNPVTRSAILRRLGADVHATLIGVAGDEVTIGLAVDPLIVWLWIGAGLLLLGGAALLWSGDGV